MRWEAYRKYFVSSSRVNISFQRELQIVFAFMGPQERRGIHGLNSYKSNGGILCSGWSEFCVHEGRQFDIFETLFAVTVLSSAFNNKTDRPFVTV